MILKAEILDLALKLSDIVIKITYAKMAHWTCAIRKTEEKKNTAVVMPFLTVALVLTVAVEVEADMPFLPLQVIHQAATVNTTCQTFSRFLF